MTSFGSVIKEIRKNRKLTQKMLSENICSQSVLSRIENDEELPNVLVVQQICQRLGVTIDQIMQLQSEEVRNITDIFQKIENYFRHKKYENVLSYMKEINIEKYLHLDTDWQQYYYYLASCHYFLYHQCEQSILDLKKGLSYTYHANKENLSDFEIQMISCLGSIYGDLGNLEEAEYFFKVSMKHFQQLPSIRIHAELAKIFYNYARFLVNNSRFHEAEKYVDQGIRWAKFKNSYYYLSELFVLKADVLLIDHLEEKAKEYKFLSEQLNFLENLEI